MLRRSGVAARATLENLRTRYGYCEHCAKDAVLACSQIREARVRPGQPDGRRRASLGSGRSEWT